MQLALLFAAFVALCTAQGETGPLGTFEAPFGGQGNFYFCQAEAQSTQFTGVFSEIGFVRFIYIKSNKSFNGTWYQPGLTLTDDQGLERPARGIFQGTMDKNISQMTGFLRYADDLDLNPREYVINRVDDVTPTPEQCFGGVWLNNEEIMGEYSTSFFATTGNWHIYRDASLLGPTSGYFNASAVPTTEGKYYYAEGTCSLNGQVCQGQVISEQFYGSVLFVIGNTNELYYTFWNGTADQVAGNSLTDLTAHAYGTNQLVGMTTWAEAGQAQVLVQQGYFFENETASSLGWNAATHVEDGAGQQVDGLFEQWYVMRGEYAWDNRTLYGTYSGPGLVETNSLGETFETTGSFMITIGRDWTVAEITREFVSTVDGSSFYGYPINVTRGDHFTWFRPLDSESLYNDASPETSPTGIFTSALTYTVTTCMDDDLVLNGSISLGSSKGAQSGLCDPVAQVCRGIQLIGTLETSFVMSITGNQTANFMWFISYQPEPPASPTVTDLVRQGEPTQSDCHAYWGVVFEGLFLDPVYGGNFSICVDDDVTTINGFYSNVGVVRGAFDPASLTWVADWYEAGTAYPGGGSTTGDVAFAIYDFNTFTGVYNQLNIPGNTSQWGMVTRIALDKQDALSCWKVTAPAEASLTGSYATTFADRVLFCQEDTVFDSSFNVSDGTPPVTIPGFADGLCYFDDKVCQGNYWLNDGVSGIALYSLLDQNRLVASLFVGSWEEFDVVTEAEEGVLRSLNLPRTSFSATETQCAQNEDIRPPPPPPTPPPTPTPPPVVDSAGQIVVSVWAVMLVLFLQTLF